LWDLAVLVKKGGGMKERTKKTLQKDERYCFHCVVNAKSKEKTHAFFVKIV
jgi:phosphoribosyl-dephospho-CoA transferase